MDNHWANTVLPASLFDVYLRYKKSTRAIVGWLCAYVSEPQIQYSYTIKDLQRLSKIACARREPLPELISFHFREAIGNRERLSQQFKRIDDSAGNVYDTYNHEFFTEKLREIYANLCGAHEHAGKKAGRCHQKQEEKENNSTSKCPYELLEVDGCEDEVYPSDLEPEKCSSAIHSKNCNSKKGTSPELADDTLGQKLEFLSFMKELDDTLALVRKVWEKAARNEVPLALAAFTTSTAFVSLKAHEAEFRVLQEVTEMKESLPSSSASQNDDRTIRQIMLMHGSDTTKRVHETYVALQSLRENMLERGKNEPSRPLQRASDYLSATWSPTPEQERRSTCALFNNVTELACCKENSDVVRAGTPLAMDVAQFIAAKGNDANSLGLKSSIGLQLLLHGFESFTWPTAGGEMTKMQPRLQSLRFAGEVATSIGQVLKDSTMPCRCCFTLASNLECFQKDVEKFQGQRRFDLFVQSPWTSGSHMLEILETSFYYSMRLCSYKHLFGSLLHLYHCLSSLGQLQKIPLLETLCNIFEDNVFPGGRPKIGYGVSFTRLKGGRLKQSKADPKQWNLAVSQYSAREAAGFGLPRQPVDSRFRYEKTSLLHLIKSKSFQIDKSAWQSFTTRLTKQQQPARPENAKNDSHREKKQDQGPDSKTGEQAMPCDNRLLELQEVLGRSELIVSEANPLPTGRINYFKLYLAVVRVLTELSNKCHAEPPKSGICTCFVETLLQRGDAFLESEMSGIIEAFGCKDVVEICKTAILKEFDLPKEEWGTLLWQNL